MAKALKRKKKTARRQKPARKTSTAKRRPAKRKAPRKTTAKKRVTKKASRKKTAKKKTAKRKAAKKKTAKKTSRKKATRKKTTRKKTSRKNKKTAKKRKTGKKKAAKKPAAKRKAPAKKRAKKQTKKQAKVFVYNLYDLKPPKGPASGIAQAKRKLSGKSTTEAAQVTGDQMLVGIAHKRRGTGSKLHTHPNEQFNFVLKGTLRVDIDGRTMYCPAGSVVHIPAGAVHSTCATEDEDVMFYVCKDTRHGITGPPIDGKEDGARYLPGFEPTDEERQKDATKDADITQK